MKKNYFVSSEEYKFTLDKEQYISYRKLSEGQRREYQSLVSRPFKLNQTTGEVTIPLSVGEDRYQLLKLSVCGWKLFQDDVEILFSEEELERFLNDADPTIIDELEAQVKVKNPWLLGEVSSSLIDEEVKKLQDLKEKKEKYDEKKVNLPSKPEGMPEVKQ